VTPERLAQIHGEAFAPERGWTAAEVSDLLKQPTIALFARPEGFALVRVVADEAELLTLAVIPNARRKGVANELMCEWLSVVDASYAFLEVAEDNTAATSLYRQHGFEACGRRKAYYARPTGVAADAVLMQLAMGPRRSSK
jgi:ribosomal-protein-alanine N-acetyltransferase